MTIRKKSAWAPDSAGGSPRRSLGAQLAGITPGPGRVSGVPRADERLQSVDLLTGGQSGGEQLGGQLVCSPRSFAPPTKPDPLSALAADSLSPSTFQTRISGFTQLALKVEVPRQRVNER